MEKDYQVWKCKIGIEGGVVLPRMADLPMREAIRRAFKEVTGVDAEFVFSGWNGELDEFEIEVIENK